MRRTRFMSLFFLMLTLAFFCLPAFRNGYFLPYDEIRIERANYDGNLIMGKLWDDAWVRDAEAAHNSSALAYLGMHHTDAAARKRLADEATAADPKLTWIYFSVYNKLDSKDPQRLELARKLQAWDPENALGYLMEGEAIRSRNDKLNWQDLDVRAQQTEWRAAMDKAFHAPRFNTYMQERFQLDRAQLRAHGADAPLATLLVVASYPLPNLLNIRQYQQLLAKLAQDQDKSGHTPEAIAGYWVSAHMGERMQAPSESLISQLIGTALQRDSYIALAPLLRKLGQNDAADSLASVAEQIRVVRMAQSGRDDIFAHSANSSWTFFILLMLSGLITVFGTITLLAVAYVNLKRWIRPDKKGRLYDALTTAENYAPIVLFGASAALYMVYYPYWVNYQYYMTAAGGMRDFEALLRNTVPSPFYGIGQPLPIGNPLLPYAWFALGGLAVVLVLHYATRGRKQDSLRAKAHSA